MAQSVSEVAVILSAHSLLAHCDEEVAVFEL